MRRPGETGMGRHYPIDLPTAEQLACDVVSVAKERQVPQTGSDEMVAYVKVGWTTFLTQVLWERLVCLGARTFV